MTLIPVRASILLLNIKLHNYYYKLMDRFIVKHWLTYTDDFVYTIDNDAPQFASLILEELN